MKTLLQVNTSLFQSGGQSTQLAQRYVDGWRQRNPEGRVVVREVGGDAIPHLTAERFQAFLAQPEARTPEQQAVAGFSDALIAELEQADTIVLGLPLYNFGVPSSLKAYFDHVARAGVTFRYTANGPVGLLEGKRAYVFAARGGLYAGTARDTQTPYLRTFLAFVGITNVEFVYAEGIAISEDSRERALGNAHAQIAELLAPALEAA